MKTFSIRWPSRSEDPPKNKVCRLRNLSRSDLSASPFSTFDDWLDAVEDQISHQNRETILLALDEFEALDISFKKGQLDEDTILGTLRHIIQHRNHFKLLLAGSHTLDEFRRWSNYLINAQTVHLSYLAADAVRQTCRAAY